MDIETVNGLAGVVALLNSLMLVPTVRALHKLAKNHEGRIVKLETKAPRKRRGRRGTI